MYIPAAQNSNSAVVSSSNIFTYIGDKKRVFSSLTFPILFPQNMVFNSYALIIFVLRSQRIVSFFPGRVFQAKWETRNVRLEKTRLLPPIQVKMLAWNNCWIRVLCRWDVHFQTSYSVIRTGTEFEKMDTSEDKAKLVIQPSQKNLWKNSIKLAENIHTTIVLKWNWRRSANLKRNCRKRNAKYCTFAQPHRTKILWDSEKALEFEKTESLSKRFHMLQQQEGPSRCRKCKKSELVEFPAIDLLKGT